MREMLVLEFYMSADNKQANMAKLIQKLTPDPNISIQKHLVHRHLVQKHPNKPVFRNKLRVNIYCGHKGLLSAG